VFAICRVPRDDKINTVKPFILCTLVLTQSIQSLIHTFIAICRTDYAANAILGYVSSGAVLGKNIWGAWPP